MGEKRLTTNKIQYRQATLFYKADEEYGTWVVEGLKIDVVSVKRMGFPITGRKGEGNSKLSF